MIVSQTTVGAATALEVNQSSDGLGLDLNSSAITTDAVDINHTGGGSGIVVTAAGSGNGVEVDVTAGAGLPLRVNNLSLGNPNIVEFQGGGITNALIDNNGRGFFDGGIQLDHTASDIVASINNTNPENANPVLSTSTLGSGQALLVNRNNAGAGNIAEFQDQGVLRLQAEITHDE